LACLPGSYRQLFYPPPRYPHQRWGVDAGDYFALFLWGLGTAPGSEAAIKAVADKFG